ncbi:M60 family metallopeptidase [Aeromonas cavernicola]|nr:M60 family metallopeptidase [Aeromonas cavernicola]
MMIKKYFLPLFILLGLSLTVLSNALANTVPHIYEQRTFQIQGKGNAIEIAKKQMRRSWSRYEPTGIYVTQGQQLVINLSSDANAYAFIQAYALHGSGNSWDETQFKLVQGDNTITAPKNGILYLANENSAGSVTMSVRGGSHFPVFEKGYHTRSDLAAMLNKYPSAPYIEFVSSKGLVTATYKTIADYFFQRNAIEPQLFLQRVDDMIAAQNRVAGYDDKPGVHQQDRHYLHMIQDTRGSLYMYATSYRTAYVNDAMKLILNGQHWGLYHENGHLQQIEPMTFHNMTEVTVNTFSLAAEKVIENRSRLTVEDTYSKIFAYLNQPSQNKNYHNQPDLFIKLGMLHQLTLSFGEQFFPNLHRAYRETARDTIALYGKDQIFMYLAAKVSGYDLTKFFEMWGMPIANNTKIAIQQLNLNVLDREIWKSTDTNPVIVPVLKTAANKISLTLSDEWLNNKRIVTFINGNYAFETYNRTAYYASMYKPSPYSSTVEYGNSNLAYGANVSVYLVPGRPGEAINLASSTRLASTIVTGPVNLTATENGFSGSMDLGLFNSNSRIIFFLNGRYMGESHRGTLYYMSSQINNNRLNFNAGVTLNNGDNVTVYNVPGSPGESIDLAKGTLLAANKFATADKNQYAYDNISLSLTNSGFSVTLPKSLYFSGNRVVFTKNGDYLGEFKNGTSYYLSTNTSAPDAVVITINTQLKPQDVIAVSIMAGSPGDSTDPYNMDALLLKRVIN